MGAFVCSYQIIRTALKWVEKNYLKPTKKYPQSQIQLHNKITIVFFPKFALNKWLKAVRNVSFDKVTLLGEKNKSAALLHCDGSISLS